MIYEPPGYVTDRILLLGRKESCVYILKGKEHYALVGGGMVHIVPDVMEQLKEYEIEEHRIQRILILHSHFDHCGIVPFFKKRWPWAVITASERARELLSAPRVIETIETLNRMIISKYGREKEAERLGLSFSGITVEAVVGEDDRLCCGDLAMEIVAVPGHSSCSIAMYVPEQKAIFASDAAGIPYGNHILTAANSNFDQYMESLKKIASYEIEVMLAEHFGARTGEDARRFIAKSKDSAVKTRQMLENSFSRTQDERKSVKEVTDRLMLNAPEGFLPREVIALVVGQMIRYIAKGM